MHVQTEAEITIPHFQADMFIVNMKWEIKRILLNQSQIPLKFISSALFIS